MNTKFLSFILVVVLLYSCTTSHYDKDNNSIRPKFTYGEKLYSENDFIELTSSEIKNSNLWLEMNHSNYEIFVNLNSDGVYFCKPVDVEKEFELHDGKLEIINNGEFGGALNYIPTDVEKDKITIIKVPINFVFEFNRKIYFLAGIAHGSDQGGALFELKREKDVFSYDLVVELDSVPEDVAIFNNKILIAGHGMFTVIEDFRKENIITDAFWKSLYPNSIIAKSEDEIYVGMRNGYSKLSLNTKEIKYYKYRKK